MQGVLEMCPLHEVTLAASGRKAGTTKKATSPKTQSTLCKAAMEQRAIALLNAWETLTGKDYCAFTKLNYRNMKEAIGSGISE